MKKVIFTILILVFTSFWAILLTILMFNSCSGKNSNIKEIKLDSEQFKSIPKIEPKTVYVQNGDTIAKLISKEYPNIINLWTYKIIEDNELIEKISEELDFNLVKENIFLFEGNKFYEGDEVGEDYYAYYANYHLHKRITKDEIVTKLIDEVNSYIKSYSIRDLSDMEIFLTRVEKYNEDLSKYSECKNYKTLKKSVISFQKKYFPIARKAYYEESKDMLWKSNIDVSLNGKTIIYTSYKFVDNGTIDALYTVIHKQLENLRFQRVGFKWHNGSGMTYWDLGSLKDEYVKQKITISN